jgi:hypothetical protein
MFSFFRHNQTPRNDDHSAATVQDRRREPRQSAKDEIVLFVPTPQSRTIRGRLIDRSATGFRASHMYPALTSGQVIRCRLDEAEFLVRVVWNRILEEEMESGFLILDNPLPPPKTPD